MMMLTMTVMKQEDDWTKFGTPIKKAKVDASAAKMKVASAAKMELDLKTKRRHWERIQARETRK